MDMPVIDEQIVTAGSSGSVAINGVVSAVQRGISGTIGSQQHKSPPITTRAKNFSKALFRFVVEGMPLEQREQAKHKLLVCEKNECGFFDGSVCRHIECGCFSKIKTFFKTEHCPVGKW